MENKTQPEKQLSDNWFKQHFFLTYLLAGVILLVLIGLIGSISSSTKLAADQAKKETSAITIATDTPTDTLELTALEHSKILTPTPSQIIPTAGVTVYSEPDTVTTQYDYSIHSNEDKGSVLNINVLISPKETDEKSTHAIMDIVLKTCQKQCNISIYDEGKALTLEMDYMNNPEQFNTPEKDEAWMRQNYVYVADHLVASHEFEIADDFEYYPYKKDSEYQKYK